MSECMKLHRARTIIFVKAQWSLNATVFTPEHFPLLLHTYVTDVPAGSLAFRKIQAGFPAACVHTNQRGKCFFSRNKVSVFQDTANIFFCRLCIPSFYCIDNHWIETRVCSIYMRRKFMTYGDRSCTQSRA